MDGLLVQPPVHLVDALGHMSGSAIREQLYQSIDVNIPTFFTWLSTALVDILLACMSMVPRCFFWLMYTSLFRSFLPWLVAACLLRSTKQSWETMRCFDEDKIKILHTYKIISSVVSSFHPVLYYQLLLHIDLI